MSLFCYIAVQIRLYGLGGDSDSAFSDADGFQIAAFGELADGMIDEAELQDGWKNGDINAYGGWFAILYGGEEQSSSYRQMIIAHLNKEENQLIQTLPKEAEFHLSLEEPYRDGLVMP